MAAGVTCYRSPNHPRATGRGHIQKRLETGTEEAPVEAGASLMLIVLLPYGDRSGPHRLPGCRIDTEIEIALLGHVNSIFLRTWKHVRTGSTNAIVSRIEIRTRAIQIRATIECITSGVAVHRLTGRADRLHVPLRSAVCRGRTGYRHRRDLGQRRSLPSARARTKDNSDAHEHSIVTQRRKIHVFTFQIT
jgi:hypothetical protein